MKLVPITRLSEEQWVAYHQMRLQSRERYQPAAALGAPKRSTEFFRKRSLDSIRELKGTEHVLLGQDLTKVLGFLRFYAHNTSFTGVFDFLANTIPQGFVRIFAQGLLANFEKYPCAHTEIFLNDQRHIQALRLIPPVQEIQFNELLLDLANVPDVLQANWLEAFLQAPGGFRLEQTVNLPMEMRADYIRLHGQFVADMALGGQRNMMSASTMEDLERLSALNALNGQCVLVIFMVAPDGQRVGFTELSVSLETGKAIQGFTGLMREYRNRGLAKVLKAAMHRFAAETAPKLKYISTTTNPHNAAMMHLNLSMGFKVQQLSSQMIFDAATLRNFVDGKGK